MLHDVTTIRSSRARIALVAFAALLALLPVRLVARTPAPPQSTAAPAAPSVAPSPGTAQAKPTPAPRPVTRQRSSVEQAIAEQQRSIQEIQQALEKLQVDTIARQLTERTNEVRKMAELLELQKSMAGTAVLNERQTTEQFLEAQLRAVTQEQEQTKLRLQRLSAEIDTLRARLDEARAAQSKPR